ncbi:sugar transferase [uncultured Adlercreutzia sp.]|uniref:sugar transferase n=1 Tax=uncultured Adlercreutzia sp. TaxID=875803 RepID=UPI002630A36A|nr:sugar transferase [uncultured Adlercreutzia sp.]
MARSQNRYAIDDSEISNVGNESEAACSDLASVTDSLQGLIDTSKVVELECIDVDSLPRKFFYRAVKRFFDIASCSLALVFLAIPMACIAIGVKMSSPGPILYRQERLGLNGRPITVVKFRSMYMNAEEDGAKWASADDPRVTPLGRKLREKRLDELPQLVAVIKGDMSLVGPRPEREVFYDAFEPYIRGFRQRLLVQPGLTGLAQVNGGYDLLPEEKIVYDLRYIEKQGFAIDCSILWKTLGVLFSYDGAR